MKPRLTVNTLDSVENVVIKLLWDLYGLVMVRAKKTGKPWCYARLRGPAARKL